MKRDETNVTFESSSGGGINIGLALLLDRADDLLQWSATARAREINGGSTRSFVVRNGGRYGGTIKIIGYCTQLITKQLTEQRRSVLQ